MTESEHKENNEYTELDPSVIRVELERKRDTSELPAVSILEEQINQDYIDLRSKPEYRDDDEKLATVLTERFLEAEKNPYYLPHISLYSKVINTPEIIPPAFDYEATLKENGEAILKEIGRMLSYTKKIKGDDIDIGIDCWYGWAHIYGGESIAKSLAVCPPREVHWDYRIYLCPEPLRVGEMVYEIATTMPEEIYYYIKTFSGNINIKTLSRGDKIICYCTKENFDPIINTVAKVCKKDPSFLKDRPVPGGGEYSPMSGISFAKELEWSTTTPSQMNAIWISATLERNSEEIARKLQIDESIKKKEEKKNKLIDDTYTKIVLAKYIHMSILLGEKPGHALRKILSKEELI